MKGTFFGWCGHTWQHNSLRKTEVCFTYVLFMSFPFFVSETAAALFDSPVWRQGIKAAPGLLETKAGWICLA